ncbi:MAG: aminopeptidase P family protein [Acidobacteriota bacterium]|nr:aminopeptidase P family protein [Acidobacteriota bacterium]
MKSRRLIAGFALAAFIATGFPQNIKAEKSDTKKEPNAIRVTPPAPQFTDAERQAELARRRQNVAERIGKNSMLILFSGEPRIYAGDVDYVFRQENNLYYLTMLKQQGATLVLLPGNTGMREFLFLPRRNPQREAWDGKMYSLEEAQRISGVKNVFFNDEFGKFLDAVKSKQPFVSGSGANISLAVENLYLLLPESERDSEGMREYRQEYNFSKEQQVGQNYKIQNAQQIFADLRHIKSPFELKILQHAIDISTEAHMRAMATAGRAKMEYEVQAEIEYIFRKRNADYWGYPSIVGCGPNATTLHYNESQSPVKPGDLLLMDVGAEYDHYTADVTRTFPINGKFTKEQAEIYQIVFDAQEAVAQLTKPGVRFQELSRASDEVLKNGLARLGLITAPNATLKITSPNGQTREFPQYRFFAFHGLGHWLGMNVHDVGDYNKPLAAGMVFTNEPGIYIRGDAFDYLPDTPETKEFLAKVRPVYERYKNIGVRIEDDMLVTSSGVEWMSKALPRKLSDIESFIARASKEIPATAAGGRFELETKFHFGNPNHWFESTSASLLFEHKTSIFTAH